MAPKTTKPAKPANGQTPAAEEVQAVFSYEFLEMLTDTAHHTLRDYLIRTEAPPVLLEMTDDLYRLMYAQLNMLEGGLDYSEDIWDSVARMSTNITKLEGTFYCPTGTIYPLQKRLADGQKRKVASAENQKPGR